MYVPPAAYRSCVNRGPNRKPSVRSAGTGEVWVTTKSKLTTLIAALGRLGSRNPGCVVEMNVPNANGRATFPSDNAVSIPSNVSVRVASPDPNVTELVPDPVQGMALKHVHTP